MRDVLPRQVMWGASVVTDWVMRNARFRVIRSPSKRPFVIANAMIWGPGQAVILHRCASRNSHANAPPFENIGACEGLIHHLGALSAREREAILAGRAGLGHLSALLT